MEKETAVLFCPLKLLLIKLNCADKVPFFRILYLISEPNLALVVFSPPNIGELFCRFRLNKMEVLKSVLN